MLFASLYINLFKPIDACMRQWNRALINEIMACWKMACTTPNRYLHRYIFNCTSRSKPQEEFGAHPKVLIEENSKCSNLIAVRIFRMAKQQIVIVLSCVCCKYATLLPLISWVLSFLLPTNDTKWSAFLSAKVILNFMWNFIFRCPENEYPFILPMMYD